MRAFFAALGRMVSGRWNEHTHKGQFWLVCGVVALIVDAAISYQYGITQTTWHGLGFALVAIFFAMLPDEAYSEFEAKRYGSALGMLAASCVLGIVALYSHLGYGAGVRVGSIQQTEFHKVKLDEQIKATRENETNLAMWQKRLADLETQNAWVATVTADALRARLASANLAIKQEEARGGCKAKCLERTKERDDLESRIALAEEKSNLTKQIEATKKILDRSRETVAATGYKSDTTTNQVSVAAQLWLAMNGVDPEKAIEPDTVTRRFVNIFVTGGGSLAFMVMAPIGFFLAGRNRRKDEDEEATHKPDLLPIARTVDRPTTVPAISLPRITGTTLADLRRIAGHAA